MWHLAILPIAPAVMILIRLAFNVHRASILMQNNVVSARGLLITVIGVRPIAPLPSLVKPARMDTISTMKVSNVDPASWRFQIVSSAPLTTLMCWHVTCVKQINFWLWMPNNARVVSVWSSTAKPAKKQPNFTRPPVQPASKATTFLMTN